MKLIYHFQGETYMSFSQDYSIFYKQKQELELPRSLCGYNFNFVTYITLRDQVNFFSCLWKNEFKKKKRKKKENGILWDSREMQGLW